MNDDFLIPLRISGTDFEPTAFPGHVGFQLRPPETEGGFSARDWPFGDGNLFATTDGHVANLGVPVDPDAADTEIHAPDAATTADEVEVQLPFGARVSAQRSTGSEVTWVAVTVEGIEPARWTTLDGTSLHVATDASGVLAELRFAVPVRLPQSRRIKIGAEHGWQGGASTWFAQDGSSTFGVNMHRAMPPMPPMLDEAAWLEATQAESSTDHPIHEPAMDGNGGMVVHHDRLEGFDGQSIDGSVELPTPDAEVDELEATITWPNPAYRVVVDRSEEPARVRFEFGATPDRWVLVGGQLLVGLAANDEVGAIVLPQLEIQDMGMGMDPAFMDPMAGMSQAEMMAHATEQMAQQFQVELERARSYAETQPFPALGPVDPPSGGPVAMRVVDGPFGDGNPIGVALEWGDLMGRMLPNGDRNAPLMVVTHQRKLDHVFPPGMEHHDDALNWLQGEQMMRRQWAVEAGEAEPVHITESMAFGPEQHQRQLAELAARAEPATLVVNGAPIDATVVRIDDAFAVRAERDGWSISVCASNFGDAIPPLHTITELDAFVEGRADADARMRDFQLQAAEQLEHASPAPPEAQASRDRAEVLMRSLQGGMHMHPGALNVPAPRDLFTQEVIDAQGGEATCAQRLELVMRVAQPSGGVGTVARDGSVAHGTIRVHLPRPDGMGVGFSVGIHEAWWDHDQEEIRALAESQLTSDQQGQYELAFNALLERQPDASMRIATDVLGLLDAHLGGLERLLEPSR